MKRTLDRSGKTARCIYFSPSVQGSYGKYETEVRVSGALSLHRRCRLLGDVRPNCANGGAQPFTGPERRRRQRAGKKGKEIIRMSVLGFACPRVCRIREKIFEAKASIRFFPSHREQGNTSVEIVDAKTITLKSHFKQCNPQKGKLASSPHPISEKLFETLNIFRRSVLTLDLRRQFDGYRMFHRENCS